MGLRRSIARLVVASALCLLGACSDDGDGDDAGGAGAGAGAAGSASGNAGGGASGSGAGGAGSGGGSSAGSGSSGDGGSNAGVGGGGNPDSMLFTDQRVPTCERNIAGGRVEGRLAGQEVSFEVGISSQIGAGEFYYVEVEDNEIVRPLDFEFTPVNLAPGVTSRLIGDVLWVPEDQPGGGRFYCITSGEFGPYPRASSRPTPDRRRSRSASTARTRRRTAPAAKWKWSCSAASTGRRGRFLRAMPSRRAAATPRSARRSAGGCRTRGSPRWR